MSQAASVAIIGGADGPTTIWIASNSIVLGLVLLAMVGGLVAFWFSRR